MLEYALTNKVKLCVEPNTNVGKFNNPILGTYIIGNLYPRIDHFTYQAFE